MNTPQWQREFPDMTDMPVIPEGWEDESWHNDAMPSFTRVINGRTYRLWVDYPTHAQSEVAFISIGNAGEYRRFLVERMPAGFPERGDGTSEAFAFFTHFGAFEVCLATVMAGA